MITQKTNGSKEMREVARKCIKQKRENRESWESHPTLVYFSQVFYILYIVMEANSM